MNKKTIIIATTITIGLLFLYVPLFITILSSFNLFTMADISQVWHMKFTIANWKNLFNDLNFTSTIILSTILSIISSTISVIIGFFIVLSISNIKSNRIRKYSLYSYSYTIFNPDIILGFTLVLLFVGLKIDLGVVTIIASNIAFQLPFTVLLLFPRIRHLRHKYDKVLVDIGIGFWRSLYKVIIPLSLKSLAYGWVICFVMSFDDFIITFLNSGNVETISVFIYTSRKFQQVFFAFGSLVFVVILLSSLTTFYFTQIHNKGKKNENK